MVIDENIMSDFKLGSCEPPSVLNQRMIRIWLREGTT